MSTTAANRPDHNPSFLKSENTYRIAIIGAGPKGLYGLERLLAQIKAARLSGNIEISLFNRSPYFGPGDIYRTDQPDYLSMNFANGFIDMWSDQLPRPVVPKPLSMTAWLARQAISQEDRAPESYSPRAWVGKYLEEGFQALLQHGPPGAIIRQITANVCDVQTEEDGFMVQWKQDGKSSGSAQKFQQILLATGHNRPVDRPQEPHFISFIYPVQQRLAHIPAQGRVAIKGMGLTWIDAVLALTQGRGGRFQEGRKGSLEYIPAGKEPSKIYPFSRSACPIVPRASTYGKSAPPLYYFIPERLWQIKMNKLSSRFDFENDLLPLIRQEIEFAYYQFYFAQHQQRLVPYSNYRFVERQIERFHQDYPNTRRFTLSELLEPLPTQSANWHTEVTNYLDQILTEAELGEEYSPYARAAGTWRHLSELFNEIYSFGGLTPRSQQQFCEQYYGAFNRVAYGPPVFNMQKMQALARAGIIDYSYAYAPQIEWQAKSKQYRLQSSDSQQSQEVDYLIDARIPKINIQKDPSPLIQNLLKRGIIRPFCNRDNKQSKEDYYPGCMDIDYQGHPINQQGETVHRICVSGTPTEGVTFDNDTLSRKRNDFVSDWAKDVVTQIKKHTYAS